MAGEAHEGWTNRETWTVHHRIGNIPALYNSVTEFARSQAADVREGYSSETNAAGLVADHIEGLIKSRLGYDDPTISGVADWNALHGLQQEAISSYVRRVNWWELGREYLQEEL